MLGLSEKLKSAAAARRQQQQDSNNNAQQGGAGRRMSIRDRLLVKEVSDLSSSNSTSLLPPTCRVQWPDPNELHEIVLTIQPDEGYWREGVFTFRITVPEEYNMAPPSVHCTTRLWHPNISEDGSVCLSLLRQSPFDELGWAPTRRIKDVVFGLNQLFTDLLNFEEPLNSEAADQFRSDPEAFEKKVRSYMREYCSSSGKDGKKK